MTNLLIIPLMAVLNRCAGLDPFFKLPGRPLWYATPLVGLLAWTTHPPLIAAAWALTYLLWRLPAWGRWFDLGMLPDGFGRDRPANLFEAAVNFISFGNDYLAMLVRYSIAIPGLLLVLPWSVALLAPILFMGCLMAAKAIKPLWTIPISDVLIGAVWGALVVFS